MDTTAERDAQAGEQGAFGHGPVTVERTWNKHHERIPDRWTWDVVDDAGVVVSVVEDDDTPAENIARLIAAAPDLMVALEQALPWLNGLCSMVGDDGLRWTRSQVEDIHATRDAARSALEQVAPVGRTP